MDINIYETADGHYSVKGVGLFNSYKESYRSALYLQGEAKRLDKPIILDTQSLEPFFDSEFYQNLCKKHFKRLERFKNED